MIREDEMTYNYSEGYITVPRNGLYYIYAQIMCDPDSNSSCGYYIRANGVWFSGSLSDQDDGNQDVIRKQSMSSGMLKKLNAGDKLWITAAKSAVYYLTSPHSYFGVFYLW